MKYGKPGILVWARERFQYFRFFFFEDCSNRWSHPTLEAGSSKKKTDSLPHECRSQYLVKRVNIWYHSDPHYQWKRFTWPVFFLRPWAVSWSETRIGQRWQAFIQCVQQYLGFFQAGAKKTTAPHIARFRWTYFKACLQKFSLRKSKIWPACVQHYAESSEKSESYTKTKSFEGNNVS